MNENKNIEKSSWWWEVKYISPVGGGEYENVDNIHIVFGILSEKCRYISNLAYVESKYMYYVCI